MPDIDALQPLFSWFLITPAALPLFCFLYALMIGITLISSCHADVFWWYFSCWLLITPFITLLMSYCHYCSFRFISFSFAMKLPWLLTDVYWFSLFDWLLSLMPRHYALRLFSPASMPYYAAMLRHFDAAACWYWCWPMSFMPCWYAIFFCADAFAITPPLSALLYLLLAAFAADPLSADYFVDIFFFHTLRHLMIFFSYRIAIFHFIFILLYYATFMPFSSFAFAISFHTPLSLFLFSPLRHYAD